MQIELVYNQVDSDNPRYLYYLFLFPTSMLKCDHIIERITI